MIINDKKYKNVQCLMEYLYKNEIIKRLKGNETAFCFHGDLISSNIIYNNGCVNYIDPRGQFTVFNICYDIAKMKFSFSGYDQVNNNKFNIYNQGNSIYFTLNEDANAYINEKFFSILRKNEIFSDSIIKRDGYWKERIRLHTALKYINNSYIQLEKGNIDKL